MHPARHRWVRKRVLSLGLHEPVALTGGVSRSRNLVALLERRRDCAVRVSPDSQFGGALGAALLARRGAIWSQTKGNVVAAHGGLP